VTCHSMRLLGREGTSIMAAELVLMAGNANHLLAEEIAAILEMRLAAAEVSQFSDGEVFV
jgi:phosphoribosylpyrophosphate synthetase